ncbi:MAG: response regulator [Verrucomicrobiae bacterium]|nr:response regulator [Verrucomicrobiae bacterium]
METITEVLGKRILLVDDDPSVRESLKLMLSFDHHTVIEAANAQEALQLLRNARYDLVITDYFLPGMRGDELARRIKELVPGQPVCIVTAFIERFASTPASADAVLGKPLSLEEIRRIVGLPVRRVVPAGSHVVEDARGHEHPSDYDAGVAKGEASADGCVSRKRVSVRRWGIND